MGPLSRPVRVRVVVGDSPGGEPVSENSCVKNSMSRGGRELRSMRRRPNSLARGESGARVVPDCGPGITMGSPGVGAGPSGQRRREPTVRCRGGAKTSYGYGLALRAYCKTLDTHYSTSHRLRQLQYKHDITFRSETKGVCELNRRSNDPTEY